MRRVWLWLLFAGFTGPCALAQTDTTGVTVTRDPRLDALVKRQIRVNEETTRDQRRSATGYRIFVVNSNDRNKVFAMKTQIYQKYPELKTYVQYLPPNYRLKAGNFRTEQDAAPWIDKLNAIVPDGVYTVRETIEVKVDIPKYDD